MRKERTFPLPNRSRRLALLTAGSLIIASVLGPAGLALAQDTGIETGIQASAETPLSEIQGPAIEFSILPSDSHAADAHTPDVDQEIPFVEEPFVTGEEIDAVSNSQKKEDPDPEIQSNSFTSDSFRPDERTKAVRNEYRLEPEPVAGSLGYSIPLTLPPGRAGMTPELSLEYSSQPGEDAAPFGYGWSVNIPYIERINRKGVDRLYTEGFFYSSLDGELASTTQSTSSPIIYGSKADKGSFRKYEFNADGSWTMREKDGRVYKFGTSTGSRLDNSASSSQIFRWLPDEVRDANGNYIKYEYFKDSGQIYPSRIVYTGNGSTDGVFEVSFTRSARSDVATSSRMGFQVVSRYVISDIQTKVNGSWVHKYDLGYAAGDNKRRSLLSSITETGRDGSGTTLALPATTIKYHASTTGWTEDTAWDAPSRFSNGADLGVRLADVNGDGLVDMVQGHAPSGASTTNKVFLNTGSGWSENGSWSSPEIFSDNGNDTGARLVDVNGDGFADIVKAKETDGHTKVHLNNATTSGWTQVASTTWQFPEYFTNGVGDLGVRIADINGDGLPDVLKGLSSSPVVNKVYINTGTTWALDANWSLPTLFSDSGYDNGSVIADVNGDGLADIIEAHNPSGTRRTFIHTGSGWSEDSAWLPPQYFVADRKDEGTRLTDVNGDNLPDVVRSNSTGANYVYINTGNGWTLDSNWALPVNILHGWSDNGVRFADVDGDNLTDIIQAEDVAGEVTDKTLLGSGRRTDLLARVDTSRGGQIEVGYKGSAEYKNGSTLLNPSLSVGLDTVHTVTRKSGIGPVETDMYAYEGGFYSYAGPHERKIAGFSAISKTDAVGNAERIFYHQGNGTDSANGEASDHISKLGLPYRVEQKDVSGNLLSKTVNAWERSDLGQGRSFLKIARITDFEHNGDSSNKSKAETHLYNDFNGNRTGSISWGEVSASNDGSFTDIGSDKASSTIAYAASSTGYLILPASETLWNQSGSKIRETRVYYDNLSLGSVSKGNQTKEERWISSSSYASTTKVYNAYGLPTEERDARGNLTTYTYDSFNLRIATTTNALGHTTGHDYDYSSGKVTRLIDPNGRAFETLYDPLDRIKEEKQPDDANPATLITKATYAYTDTGTPPSSIRKISYLNAATSTDLYTYLDGLGRTVQTRRTAEGSNTFAVEDTAYDSRGLLSQKSLPYVASSTAYATPTSNGALYSRFVYDGLRLVSEGTAAGTTTYAYGDWRETVTDARGKSKDVYRDAYGNLSAVVEWNGGSPATTTYMYDRNGNLTSITDAANNVRAFTYDGLGRRLSAEDLHAPADGTFGTWTYNYDAAGNLVSELDPNGHTIEHAYDALNRIVSTDDTGASGTEITYNYDSCSDGKGRLCAATTTDSITRFDYTPNGRVKEERKTIDGTEYRTAYEYDRQGNIVRIVYPTGLEVSYSYNSVGLLESVSKKEGGDSGFVSVVTNFNYSPTGQVARIEYANGVLTVRTYDASMLYRLTNILTTKI
jgi:YD repeat-containing protein